MHERPYEANWLVQFPAAPSPDNTWGLLRSLLLVNWRWDAFIWDLRELHRLLTTAPAEFNYLYVTAFLKARAAHLAVNGPFDCQPPTILAGIATRNIQFAAIYYRLFVTMLVELVGSDLGRTMLGSGEARRLQLAIEELEQKYLEILEVICLSDADDGEPIHGLDIASWVTGTQVVRGKRIRATPPAVTVLVQATRCGWYTLVRPSNRDLVRKIRRGDPMRAYLERSGASNEIDRQMETLSRFPKVGDYPVFRYGELVIQHYVILINPQKDTLYLVCADRTLRLHQRDGCLLGSRPVLIEYPTSDRPGGGVYMVTFDDQRTGAFSLDFRAHKYDERVLVPEEVWRQYAAKAPSMVLPEVLPAMGGSFGDAVAKAPAFLGDVVSLVPCVPATAPTTETGDPKAEAVAAPVASESTRSMVAAALVLAEKLDSNPRVKAPNHMTVFKMYCQDNLTVQEVEKKCSCSHGTIMNRKRAIEAELKVPLEQFRDIGGIFEPAMKTIEDGRASNIYRKGLVDDTGEDQDA